MLIETTPIKDLLILRPNVMGDSRGYFSELYKKSELNDFPNLVQINESKSAKGVMRWLHYQPTMGKAMRILTWSAFLVAIDIRKNSDTYGKWFGKILTANDICRIYAPDCFARGFLSLEDDTRIQYWTTWEYNKEIEWGFNPLSLDIDWPKLDTEYILSDKDRNAVNFPDFISPFN